MNNFIKKLKKKNLLWYSALVLILFGIYGVSTGVWITYNGIVLNDNKNDALLSLLDSLGMTIQDGVNAFIFMGSFIIILYLLEIGTGCLGILSSTRILRKRSLFWFSIFLIIIFLLLGLIGLFGWTVIIINLIILLVFTFSVFTKYNFDQLYLKKRKQKQKHFSEEKDTKHLKLK